MRRISMVLIAVLAASLGLAAMWRGQVSADDQSGSWQRARGEPPPSIAPGADASGQTIFPPDTRFSYSDTSLWPLSAVTHLEMYDEADELIWTCTGTLISPLLVLTAAHCLENPLAPGLVSNIAVVPGRNGDVVPFGYQWAVIWYHPGEWDPSQPDLGYDYGLILLPDASMGEVAGWMPLGVAEDATLSEPDLKPAMFGYPADKPYGTMWGAGEYSLAGVDELFLYHFIDVTNGQSGAALFSTNVEGLFAGHVVGVMIMQFTDVNVARRVEAGMVESLRGACAQVGCSIDVWWEVLPTPTPSPTPQPTPTPPPGGMYRVVAPGIQKSE